MWCGGTYDVDELDHGQTELDGDDFAEVGDGSDERVVAVTVKQRLYQSHLILASESYQQQRILRNITSHTTFHELRVTVT